MRATDDAARFDDLVRRTQRDLLAYLGRRVRPADDAADLLADVYLLAWEKRDRLPPPGQDRLWLFGIARRLVLAHGRGRLRETGVSDDLRALVAGSAVERDRAEHREVHDALARLDEIDRELLTLTVWDGLTPAEAARVVGLRAGTARVRLHRARGALRRHLEGEAIGPLRAVAAGG